jgi:hypothetical protein
MNQLYCCTFDFFFPVSLNILIKGWIEDLIKRCGILASTAMFSDLIQDFNDQKERIFYLFIIIFFLSFVGRLLKVVPLLIKLIVLIY